MSLKEGESVFPLLIWKPLCLSCVCGWHLTQTLSLSARKGYELEFQLAAYQKHPRAPHFANHRSRMWVWFTLSYRQWELPIRHSCQFPSSGHMRRGNANTSYTSYITIQLHGVRDRGLLALPTDWSLGQSKLERLVKMRMWKNCQALCWRPAWCDTVKNFRAAAQIVISIKKNKCWYSDWIVISV